MTSSTLRVSSSCSGVVAVMKFLSFCARSAAGLRQYQLATSWYSPASSRAASTSASVSALSAVTLTVEVPSTTRSICTSVTPGRTLSSLVMAPTQCPQVSPVTGKVWVLMWFSLGWVLPGWICVVWSGAADGSGAHQARDRGRGLLELGRRLVATVLDGLRDAVVQVLVQQGQCHRLQRLGGSGDLGQHVDAVRVLLDHAVHAPNLTLDPAQSPQVGILGGVVARRIGVHGRPPSQVPGGGIPHDRNHTPDGYIPQHPGGRMARGDDAYTCSDGSVRPGLRVGGGFVSRVAAGLELDGAVLDVEVSGQALLELVEQAGQVPVVEARVVNHNVGGQHRQTRSHLGSVQIVDRQHVSDRDQMLANLAQLQSLGRGLQQDIDALAQQLQGARDDHRSNQD